MIGWYQPHAPGARTLREAKPLYVEHDLVTAQVYQLPACTEPAIAIFVGVKLVYEGPLPLEVTKAHHVNPFIQRFIADYERE